MLSMPNCLLYLIHLIVVASAEKLRSFSKLKLIHTYGALCFKLSWVCWHCFRLKTSNWVTSTQTILLTHLQMPWPAKEILTIIHITFIWLHDFISNVLVPLPSVLWRCWLGGRKGIRPVKNWVVGCWRGYVSGDLHMAQLMPLPLTVSCFS